MTFAEKYKQKIAERAKNTRVTKKFQLLGLELALLLGDIDHRSLYIKLAKEMDSDVLMGLAKDIASRDAVKNKGAYFMKVLKVTRDEKSQKKKIFTQ